jgi:hypothetical protein
LDYWLRCSYLPFIVFTLLTIILITFTFTDKHPIDSHPLPLARIYQDGKPIREIARVRQAHLSFGSIGKIIRTINSGDDANSDNCSSKSKSTKALYLFKTGKKPIDVAIEFDISASEVEELQQEFWALNQLYELAF